MMGEPWCYTPDEVARLTDFQIWHQYMRPAAERAKQLGGGGRTVSGSAAAPVAGSDGPPGEPGSDEHRRACVGAYMSVQGLNRERAEAQYARQLAQWHSEHKGA